MQINIVKTPINTLNRNHTGLISNKYMIRCSIEVCSKQGMALAGRLQESKYRKNDLKI